ncbi:hypothetical protein P0D69_39995 [Paraburkholderia sediminicola]|uniref:hypothetical protein n=1 Tax=Paraburkholderia sediminicola TaxID=458836 RepID=UPI0038BB586C
MNENFKVAGASNAALFSVKLHRGDGMTLIAMDWKEGKPLRNFVAFWIAYKEPVGNTFYDLNNRRAAIRTARSSSENCPRACE